MNIVKWNIKIYLCHERAIISDCSWGYSQRLLGNRFIFSVFTNFSLHSALLCLEKLCIFSSIWDKFIFAVSAVCIYTAFSLSLKWQCFCGKALGMLKTKRLLYCLTVSESPLLIHFIQILLSFYLCTTSATHECLQRKTVQKFTALSPWIMMAGFLPCMLVHLGKKV